MTKGIIIGAGVSGLIWKFYNPDWELIAPVQEHLIVGNNSFRKQNNCNEMIWLHDSYETRKLVHDLGLQTETRQSYVGYYNNGIIKDNLTTPINEILIKKKMCNWKKIDSNYMPNSSALSLTQADIGANYMRVLNITQADLIQSLMKKCKITHGYMGEVNRELVGITNEPPSPMRGYVYSQYDILISTIPAPFFWKAWNKMNPNNQVSMQTDSIPITMITVNERPEQYEGTYEMIYYDFTVPFTRIRDNRNGTWTIEFTGIINKEEFEKLFSKLPVQSHTIIPQGRIFSNNQNYPPTNRIAFSGRFAQWNHAITTEHVINQCLNFNRKGL